jgi:hypothetical protein
MTRSYTQNRMSWLAGVVPLFVRKLNRILSLGDQGRIESSGWGEPKPRGGVRALKPKVEGLDVACGNEDEWLGTDAP